MKSTGKLWLTVVLALLTLLISGLLGGAGNTADAATVRALGLWRLSHPNAGNAIAGLTHVGGGAVLSILAAIGAITLLVRKQFATVLAFLAATLGGRFMIEFVKFTIERPRPAFDDHPVYTTNYSFPSGHAGNSMMTFLALAIFLSPPEKRRANVLVAICVSLAIGLTSPVLGVHWPTDIVAGWIFGALWVAMIATFIRRRQTAA